MAEHPAEVADIASSAAALTVSLGNITDARAESMFLAGKAIKRMNNTENGKKSLCDRPGRDRMQLFPHGTCKTFY